MQASDQSLGRTVRVAIGAVLAVLLLVVVWRSLGSSHQTNAPKAVPTSVLPLATAKPFLLPANLASYHLAVTDLQSGDVGLMGQTTLLTGGGPHGLALQPGGRYLWVTNSGGFNVWIIDLRATGGPRVTASLTVGPAPVHVAFSPDGARAYVTNFGGSSVTVVDVARHLAINSITTPAGPHGIAISPDGRWLYIACVEGGAFVVADTTTLQVVATVPMRSGAVPYGVAIAPDGRHVYVSDATFGQLLAIDTTTHTQVGAAFVGSRPALVTWIPTTHLLAVADNGDGTVTLVDATTMQPTHTLVTEGRPHGVSATADGHMLFVADTESNTVTVIDIARAVVVSQLKAGTFPNDVAVLPS